MSPNGLVAVVHGQVQGVGFRAWTRVRARKVGVTVEAENLPDGTVRVVVRGDRAGCLRLIDQLRGADAPGQVDDVVVTWGVPDERSR